jgi:hypothetical protein
MSYSRAEVRAAAADIKRRATIIGLMRRALDPAPILDGPSDQNLDRMPRRPRPIFVFPQNARLRRVLLSCICRRAQ